MDCCCRADSALFIASSWDGTFSLYGTYNSSWRLSMNLGILPQDTIRLAQEYRSNPRFGTAARHFVQRYLENFKDNFVLNHLSSSEINHIISAYLFYLHYRRDRNDPASGVTLSRMQSFCAERGLAGPRKIAALLGILQAAGYLAREAVAADARVKVLRPTSKATSALNGVVRSHIEAIEIIEHSGDYDRFASSPEAIMAISSHGFELLYMSGVKIIDAVDELKPFLEMDNALKIVFSSYLGRNDSRIYNTSFNLLSKTFGISRTHVQRILEKAQESQQLRILSGGGRKIELMPSMIELIETYISVYLAAMARGARDAMEFHSQK